MIGAPMFCTESRLNSTLQAAVRDQAVLQSGIDAAEGRCTAHMALIAELEAKARVIHEQCNAAARQQQIAEAALASAAHRQNSEVDVLQMDLGLLQQSLSQTQDRLDTAQQDLEDAKEHRQQLQQDLEASTAARQELEESVLQLHAASATWQVLPRCSSLDPDACPL